MNNIELKIFLLGYSNLDYIEELQSYYVDNKLIASLKMIERFVNKYKLKITDLDSLLYNMNMLKFGSIDNWDIITLSNTKVRRGLYDPSNYLDKNSPTYNHDLQTFQINSFKIQVDIAFYRCSVVYDEFRFRYGNIENDNDRSIIYKSVF